MIAERRSLSHLQGIPHRIIAHSTRTLFMGFNTLIPAIIMSAMVIIEITLNL